MAREHRHNPYWQNFPLDLVVIHDYTGDGTNDRQVDLGVDCDAVEVRSPGSFAANVSHLVCAHALRTAYSVCTNDGPAAKNQHRVGAAGDDYWQGKMSGANLTKIELGANGALASGTNVQGRAYRVLGYRFHKPRVT